jgi:hypothetical protein
LVRARGHLAQFTSAEEELAEAGGQQFNVTLEGSSPPGTSIGG